MTETYPSDLMCRVAARHAQKCMAAIGRETAMGAAGWKWQNPQNFIREAILSAMMEHENYTQPTGEQNGAN